MTDYDPKATLQRYLQEGRNAMLAKLEGLSEYDTRRPMTPTGTNLLGLVKHLAAVEAGYFGEVFGRPFLGPHPWDEADPVSDLVAEASESREFITGWYRQVWAHADETIGALPLDAPGRVGWWGERGEVTLHQILVHVATETHRHAGHADIARELIDGLAGMRRAGDNMPSDDPEWWKAHYERVEREAREAAKG